MQADRDRGSYRGSDSGSAKGGDSGIKGGDTRRGMR
jgi:hypothetical protein